ncbi:MAG: outer membrane protein [Acidobacteriaceae bacterium]|nr:outer membrane protein [Acidobacteriaceae bacterium]
MSGRLSIFLCVLLAMPTGLIAQQTSPPTVDDLVRTGLARNKNLLAIRERIAEAQGTLTQAGVRPATVLDLKGATGKPLGTYGEEQYGAGFSQSIETFGKRSKRIQVANFGVAQAEAELQEGSAALAFEIRSAAAERRAEQQKLALLDEAARVNAEAQRLTDARVHEGDVAPLEANLLRVETNRALVLRRSAQARLTTAELNLRRLSGLMPGEALPPTSYVAPSAEDLGSLKTKAVESRADLHSARLQEEQSQAGVQLAKANGKPDLNLSVGYIRQYSQFDDLFGQTPTGAIAPLRDRDDILSFGVSIPLRTSRSVKGDVQAAAARTSGARLRREYLERSIPLEVESAYQRWTAANESIDLLRSGVVDPSASNLQVIREAYKLGQLRLLDVLNEQRRLVDTELAFIDAQADATRSWAEVERAIGGNLP